MRMWKRARRALAATLTASAILCPPSASGQELAGELTDYVDPDQQTLVSYGDRSHWLQPWRAYLDTVPAVRLQQAVGIVFNGTTAEADASARLLAANGFRRARFEVGWSSISYDDPSRFIPGGLTALRTRLLALKKYGIRPLILLNSNHGGPCPIERVTLGTVEPALEGDTRIHLDAATAQAVVPGRTGFNSFQTSGKAADPLITSVDPDGWATLSRPLRRDLPAGSYSGSKLLYEPFHRPLRADGSPEPRFEATMAGWLEYVQVVTREARAILGGDDFDVEVWNELHFASEFIDVDEYYHPNVDTGQGDTTEAMLDRTVAWLRDPANGAAGVGIANGFASQRPWDAGSTSPPGLTAIAKHPYLYRGMRSFPPADVDEVRPLDAQGDPDGTFDPLTEEWTELFTPTYQDFHPERYLWATEKTSAIEMDGMIRDLSPHTTYLDSVAHGRHTHPPGSAPPAVWVTEMNLNPLHAPSSFGVTEGDRLHMQAKSTLRTLTAFVNKGVSAVHLYAATSGSYALVADSFFSSLKQTGIYPGDGAGGEVMDSVGRLMDGFAGATPIAEPRSLALLRVGDYAGNRQFEGDGSADHPPLHNRDVLAFLPFQVSPRRFVVAVYVMTANLARSYDPSAPSTDPTRFDMPEETYRLTIGNVSGDGATVSATDPLTGET
ncbi:MAG: hypothetical protein ACRDLD_04305, partial [Thermoleophilaceae bacterium]